MKFKVRLASSGDIFTARETETVLDEGLRESVSLPHRCGSGTCGACKARLVVGEVEDISGPSAPITREEKAAGFRLLCQSKARSDLVIEVVPAVADASMSSSLPCRVIETEQLTHEVTRLFLRLPEGVTFEFFPGQYVDILLKGGKRRSFSIASAPSNDRTLELHVRQLEGGVFGEYVASQIQVRDLLRIEGPFGDYRPRSDTTTPIILMAGGTGFAPIKSITEWTLARYPSRKLYLYWGVRNQSDLYLQDLVCEWERHECFKYVPVLSEPQAGTDWPGRTGWVHVAVAEDFPSLRGVEVYASGPPGMVSAGRTRFLKQGLDAGGFYADGFEPLYNRK